VHRAHRQNPNTSVGFARPSRVVRPKTSPPRAIRLDNPYPANAAMQGKPEDIGSVRTNRGGAVLRSAAVGRFVQALRLFGYDFALLFRFKTFRFDEREGRRQTFPRREHFPTVGTAMAVNLKPDQTSVRG
jgi:hypothetical protein